MTKGLLPFLSCAAPLMSRVLPLLLTGVSGGSEGRAVACSAATTRYRVGGGAGRLWITCKRGNNVMPFGSATSRLLLFTNRRPLQASVFRLSLLSRGFCNRRMIATSLSDGTPHAKPRQLWSYHMQISHWNVFSSHTIAHLHKNITYKHSFIYKSRASYQCFMDFSL